MDNLKDYEVENALYDLKFDYEAETDLLEESLLNVCELKGIAEVLGNELDEKLERILYMRAK